MIDATTRRACLVTVVVAAAVACKTETSGQLTVTVSSSGDVFETFCRGGGQIEELLRGP